MGLGGEGRTLGQFWFLGGGGGWEAEEIYLFYYYFFFLIGFIDWIHDGHWSLQLVLTSITLVWLKWVMGHQDECM